MMVVVVSVAWAVQQPQQPYTIPCYYSPPTGIYPKVMVVVVVVGVADDGTEDTHHKDFTLALPDDWALLTMGKDKSKADAAGG